MSELYNRIADLCKKRAITVTDLCRETQVSRGSLSDLKMGRAQSLSAATISKIADYFCVPMEFLLHGVKEKPPVKNGELSNYNAVVQFPVIGTISAGYDGQAVEEYTGEVAFFAKFYVHSKSEDYFVLRIKGSSMYPRLLDGDIVLVRRTTSVDSGKTAVVLYNGDDATVKRVNYVSGEDWLELVPINPEYPTHIIEGADLEQCRVLGEVVAVQRAYI